ncbi:MAG: hypothetical protein JSS20_17660 [Proteobacteria bacterium]|nr:hypothetical protein [Pseudomonadota bacterium]
MGAFAFAADSICSLVTGFSASFEAAPPPNMPPPIPDVIEDIPHPQVPMATASKTTPPANR